MNNAVYFHIAMTDSRRIATTSVYFIVKDMLYSLQSVADDEVFLPNDEIWVYDLERGVW